MTQFKKIIPALLLLGILSLSYRSAELRRFYISGRAQGTTYHITYYAADSLLTRSMIDSIFDQVDSSLSLYKPYSLVNRFNTSAEAVKMDRHMRKVVKAALETSRITGGIFDMTVFPLTNAWGFGPAGQQPLPDSTTVRNLMGCIGSEKIRIKGDWLYKTKPCVQLDPNGIAQGYAVDLVAGRMEALHIRHYLVELGGELRVKGRKQPSGQKMSIGIEAPGENDFEPVMEQVIYLDKGAVTTSGNYRRYHETNGKRRSHLLDLRTGYPISNELISVTIVAPDAMTADALDNALMGMGLQQALRFVEKRPALAAHFIYHRADGSVTDTMSSRFKRLLKP
ncbi:MAG: FAD:protein FMN transferase [Chitinophagaceae bacterium]|nr:FAD:protein FMN transferase [Chitinophagaceae bacterium]